MQHNYLGGGVGERTGAATRRKDAFQKTLSRTGRAARASRAPPWPPRRPCPSRRAGRARSEEHTSELQSLMRISYAVFCLKKKTTSNTHKKTKLYHMTHKLQ